MMQIDMLEVKEYLFSRSVIREFLQVQRRQINRQTFLLSQTTANSSGSGRCVQTKIQIISTVIFVASNTVLKRDPPLCYSAQSLPRKFQSVMLMLVYSPYYFYDKKKQNQRRLIILGVNSLRLLTPISFMSRSTSSRRFPNALSTPSLPAAPSA